MFNRIRLMMLFASLLGLMSPSLAGVPEVEARLSVAQLQEDLAFLKKSIARVHPDLSFSADPQQMALAFASTERQLQKPLTRNEAWRALSALNPVFADAHMQVTMGDFDEEAAAHLNGGGFFPYEVHIDGKGELFIRSEVGGGATPLAGMRIDSINGMPARSVTRALLALTYGDTPALRANLLAGRWWRFYWKAFGTPGRFELAVAQPDGLTRISRAAVARLPYASSQDNDFDQAYRFEMLSPKVALLTIDTFLWPDKKLFYAFTENMFTRLRDAGAGALIIDIRDNGGGDDDMWKQGLLRYIADKPYRHGSSYLKMVIEGRTSGAEKVGDIIDGTIQTWEQPEPVHPLHFSGKTYVVVGRTTYSSSILFSNTLQDFKFATIVGEGGYARARQSGGIQHMVLPNTKLGLIVPRFILERPSGLRTPELIRPDLVLADDPYRPRAIIDALHARIVKEK